MTLLTEQVSDTAHLPAPAASRRRWLVLAAITLAQLMVVLDATVVNIALPSAQHALGFSTADRQWIVTAYSLAFGSLLLLGGRLADLFGARRVLIVGMIGFAAASALGGAATGFTMLVVARAVQGAFGALLAPAALSQLTTTFQSPRERTKAFGIFGAVAGTGGAIGLILGGFLTEYVDWRWCLYVNLVMVVFALAGALMFIPSGGGRGRVVIDWPGVFTVGFGLVGIVYGFSEADTRGWADPVTLGILAGGIAFLVAFVLIERRVANPLLPLRVLADRNRAGADLVILVSGVGIFGVFLFLTYYIQQVLRFSPLMSGVAFLPMVAALLVTSTVATATLLPRFGPRRLVPLGLLVASTGMVILAQLGTGSGYGSGVVPGLVVTGLGLGLVFGSAMNLSTAGAATEDAGVASALPNIGQQVGGAIGTALLNTLAASTAATYIRTHSGTRATSLAIQLSASVRGDDVAFWVAALVFAVGAAMSAAVFTRSVPVRPSEGGLAPAHML